MKFLKLLIARVIIGLLMVPAALLFFLASIAERFTEFGEMGIIKYRDIMVKLRMWSEE